MVWAISGVQLCRTADLVQNKAPAFAIKAVAVAVLARIARIIAPRARKLLFLYSNKPLQGEPRDCPLNSAFSVAYRANSVARLLARSTDVLLGLHGNGKPLKEPIIKKREFLIHRTYISPKMKLLKRLAWPIFLDA